MEIIRKNNTYIKNSSPIPPEQCSFTLSDKKFDNEKMNETLMLYL